MTDDFHGEPEALASSAELGQASEGYIRQAGAICLRFRQGRAEVLLIRGLKRGRWGIPKGGVEPGETTSQAAEREAFEEAGVSGRCEQSTLGSFEYRKTGKLLPCRVSVHLLEVCDTAQSFPEMHIRTSLWTDRDGAIELVAEDGLKRILSLIA